MKQLLQLVVLALIMTLSMSVVSAVNNMTYDDSFDITRVKIDGNTYRSGQTISVELGEELEFDIELNSMEDIEDVQVSVELRGYDQYRYNRVDDISDLFDMDADRTKYVDLSIDLPYDLDKEEYVLVIEAGNGQVNVPSKTFYIDVEGPRDAMKIKDVILSPGSQVVAGRGLTSMVLLENIGERDQDDVKVTVEMPALGISDAKYVDEVDAADDDERRGEKRTSEELFLRIPACAAPGVYDILVTVEYDDGYERVSTTESVLVLDGDLCTQNQETQTPDTVERTVVTAPQGQDVEIGTAGASYPLVLQNAGSQAKQYTVSVSGVDAWGTYQVSDQTPIVAGGDSKVVYVYVRANEGATPGLKAFEIDVATGDSQKTITTTANLVGSTADSVSLRDYLQIGVIVLVALLIILGFIVIFTKLKDREDDSEKGQTYY